jgi:hypothetical protein
MGAPTSSATIMFPADLFDQEIRNLLEKEYAVEFQPQIFGPAQEIQIKRLDDSMEIEIQEGLLVFSNGEAGYGEFAELEELLVKKGIAFDRESSMDWDRPPETRVFRPGDPPLNAHIPDDESSGPLSRLLKASKAILPAFDGDTKPNWDDEILEFEAAVKEAEHLMPTYPPLRDYAKEAKP